MDRLGLALPVEADVDAGRAEIVLHRRAHREIAQVVLRANQNINIAENAAHAQLVLVLQVAAVAPFQHEYGQLVFPFLHIGGDFKLARAVGNLAVTHKLPVHPHIEAGIHAFKVQVRALLALLFREEEGRAVGAAGVFLGT